MYVSTPTDLIDSLNEEIYNYIPDEKKKRREIFSLKNGKVWLSFNDDCYYTVILRSTTLLLLGAATKTDPTAAICVARSKPAKSFVRDGKTYHFAPEYDNVLNSRCPGIDFFKNQPKIPVIDNFFHVIFLNKYNEEAKNSFLSKCLLHNTKTYALQLYF